VVVTAATIAIGPFDNPAAKTTTAWVVAVILGLGACAVIAFGHGRWVIVGVVVVVATIVVELGAMARHAPMRRVSVPAAITSTTGAPVDFLRTHSGRVMSLTQDRFGDAEYMIEGLRPNVNATFDIRSIDGYDGGPQVRANWIEAARALTDDQVNTELTLRSTATTPLDPELYARLGVRWALVETSTVPASTTVPGWDGPVVENGTMALYENPSYGGDAFLYHATRRVARRPSAVLRAMDATERRTVALVDDDGPRLGCDDPCERTPVRVRRESPEHLVLRTDARTRTLLAVTEQREDGWTAEIDGSSADVVEVDGFMIGVEVPAGTHEVTLRYRAPGLRAGVVITVLAGALVIVLIAWRGRPWTPFRRAGRSATHVATRRPGAGER
jgi:hypothetical protein